ncbi:MAG: hypothetical protein HYY97_08480 [Rhodocyclales bacterium]|nr:hypothetical protein [Rhodocyclales bacterium]
MKSSTSSLAAVSGLLLLAGCASLPDGPSVMALPGSGKSFEQFRSDDAECRRYAHDQIGGSSANQAAADAGVRSAVVGTAVGAVAGAAIGGRDAVGVGAGTGLLVGSLAGAGAAQSSGYGSQHSYDHAYVQCMYAKGQRVPVTAAQRSQLEGSLQRAPAAPAGSAYPPPPGNPPPPPGVSAR